MSMNSRQQKIKEILSQLGLTDRASRVFCVLLEFGVSTAIVISKQVQDIPRTSIYDILKTLQNGGLVSSFDRDGDIYYRVENVEHAVDVVEEQKRVLVDKQNVIRSAADIFHQFKSGTIYEPGTRFFDGKKGILAIHRELQNARTETRTIVNVASVYQVFPRMLSEDNLKDFQIFQTMKKDLMIRSKEAERYLKVAPVTKFHQVKWLPSSVQFNTDTLIWAGHVAIIDYAEHLSGVVIDNPTIADTFVAWFEMVWNSINE